MVQYRIIKSKGGVYYPQKKWPLGWKHISIHGFTSLSYAQKYIDKYLKIVKKKLFHIHLKELRNELFFSNRT